MEWEKIKISKENYDHWLEYYLKVGTSGPLKLLLSLGPVGFNIKKLQSELEKIAAGSDRPDVQPSAPVEQKPTQEKHRRKPASVKRLVLERNRNYKNVGNLRKELWSDSQSDRRVAALKITEIMRRNTELWSIIDYFDLYGTLPPDHDKVLDSNIEELKPHELITLQNTNRSYITKTRPKIAKFPKKAKRYQKEVNRRLAENERIKKILSKV